MPNISYTWAPGALERILANGVPFLDIEHALVRSHPVSRRYVGASLLRWTARGRDGGWLAVDLIETDRDDHYAVHGAHWCDTAEEAAIRTQLNL